LFTRKNFKMSKVPSVDMSNYDKQGSLDEMFKIQANATPNAVAVVNIDGSMVSSVVCIKLKYNMFELLFSFKVTFRELDDMTDVLAAKLRSIGVGKNSMVGIMMERCLEYTISYIAIHKAGTYVIIICLLFIDKVLMLNKLYSKIALIQEVHV